MTDLFIVANPGAGGKDRLSELKQALAEAKLEATFLKLGHKLPKSAKPNAIVAAAGGDGTVNAVAAMLAGTKLTLGVIPLGTLNHFAKDLGIPLDLNEAVSVLRRGRTIKVDTAEVNGNLFVNNSSIGIYPHIVRERDKQPAHLGKWVSAAVATVKILLRLHAYKTQLTVDSSFFKRRTPFIFVGNNHYQVNDLGIANRTDLTGGQLCLYLIRTSRAWGVIKVVLRILLGRVKQERDFESFTPFEVSIKLKQKVAVAVDGEVKTLAPPLKYKIRPKSLLVIVP